jgi:hypothetical protein
MSDSSGLNIEAALVVVVPESEPLVRRFRAKYDPVTALGVPAHITINYPFLPGVKPTSEVLRSLSQLFAGVAPFSFTLDHTARFPNTVYLAPVSTAPLVSLIKLVSNEFPESPTYGGQFETIIPHLMVANSDGDSELLALVESELREAALQHLPIHAYADSVYLMDDSAGRWAKRVRFPLGSG